MSSKVFHVISNVLFFAGLSLAAVFLFFHFTGRSPFHFFIVSSGSMAPTLPVGSAVVVRSAPTYYPGDVITFKSSPTSQTLITHRLLYTEPTYITAGDANSDLDPYRPAPASVVGKVVFSLPFVGYLANFAKTPHGFILLVIVPATIIIYEELKSLLKELKRLSPLFRRLTRRPPASPPPSSPPPSSPSLKPALLLPVFFATLITLSLTISFFIDKETSAGNIFVAAAAPFPTLGFDLDAIEALNSQPAP